MTTLTSTITIKTETLEAEKKIKERIGTSTSISTVIKESYAPEPQTNISIASQTPSKSSSDAASAASHAAYSSETSDILY